MGSSEHEARLRKVEIHVTDACTNRCVFCTTGRRHASGKGAVPDVPRATVRRQLEAAFADGFRRALFQGGEPTLRRDLGDLLADARAIGFEATTVFTNARSAASPGGARALAALGATWFQVSIHGGTAGAHDAAAGRPGAFRQTVAGVRRMLEAGLRVQVNSVLTRHLLGSLPAYTALVEALRPESVGLDVVMPTGAHTVAAAYGELCPPLSRHAGPLRDTVLALERAGVLTRLVNLPPCLVPGAERFTSEETTTRLAWAGAAALLDKGEWRRGLKVKAAGCVGCACDDTCGGVYRTYAEAHGLDALRPLAARPVPAPCHDAPPARIEAPLTAALRRLLVRTGSAVRAVRQREDGTVELEAGRPEAPVVLLLGRPGVGPAYATTARFSVRYRNAPGGGTPDLGAVDATLLELRRVEGALGAT
jgi:hypothetical protein